MTGEPRGNDKVRRPLTRRRFLSGIGMGAGAAVAAGYGISVWTRSSDEPTATGHAKPPILGGRSDRTLVVVELAGGNDGLSTVVPLTDPAYHTLRPTLAVANPIALDADIGLEPHLETLASRYSAGHVAMVEGVGYPDPNLSHFASLAYWWAGTPGQSDSTGWLGRYLDGTVGFADPLAAVSIGPTPSPALIGAQSFSTAIADATGLEPKVPAWADGPDELFAAWRRFARADTDHHQVLDEVRDALKRTAKARRQLDRALSPESRRTGLGPSDDLVDPTTIPPTTPAARRATPVTASLELAAQLVASTRPPRIVYVSGLGDYDTHQGQAQRHPALMADLDAGLSTFLSTVEAACVADRALVMTTSEFGRRAAENGSGTDHGTAAPHFFIGSQVKGGRYGAPPSLTKLDARGNLVYGVDFRALYATALQSWLGVDAEAIVGKRFAPLPVLA